MAKLEPKRWSADRWTASPQRLRASQGIEQIDRDRLVVEALQQGMTQTEAAEHCQISQATVHRIAGRQEQIKADLEDPQPQEVIARYWVGQITHDQMMSDLLARTFTKGYMPEGGHDAYVRGTWDQIRTAVALGMLTETEREQLRERVEVPKGAF